MEPAMTPEQEARRMTVLGLDPTAGSIADRKLAMTQRAGIPVEILFARNMITKDQAQAANEYRTLVDRYRRLWGVPDGTRSFGPATGTATEPDGDKARQAAERYRAATDALARCPARVMVAAVVDEIVIKEDMPPLFTSSGYERARAHLQIGLDALAVVFRVGRVN